MSCEMPPQLHAACLPSLCRGIARRSFGASTWVAVYLMFWAHGQSFLLCSKLGIFHAEEVKVGGWRWLTLVSCVGGSWKYILKMAHGIQNHTAICKSRIKLYQIIIGSWNAYLYVCVCKCSWRNRCMNKLTNTLKIYMYISVYAHLYIYINIVAHHK